ncbi:MAG: iron ABC transporter permease [Hyphomicrobium sp.]|nr:MAG: iron ABC transporter permease [Hyphomicrobium sp.]MBZ0210256.1 iron ABC transporter permease [Hyphomicrobium sp.]
MVQGPEPVLPRASLPRLFDAACTLLGQLSSAFKAHRRTRRVSPAWTAIVAAILLVVALPIATVLLLALSPSDNIWPHLASTVLPGSLARTLLLSSGVGLLTFAVGTATAWLVTMYRFPARELLDRLLVLPLAVPTYIIAYCYVELLDYAGPVQTQLRAAFGFTGAGDYWFPHVRSLGGAILVFSAVLYPYVYLTARASFAQQSVCVLEVARTLGRTPLATFADVALPIARPAIAAGVALVIMECLNDLGAVQYLGVDTLSASIFATWVQRSNIGGAAQLATVMLVLVAGLFAIERAARGDARSHHTTGRYRAIPFQEITGWKGLLTAALASLPFVFGFVVPVLVIAPDAAAHLEGALSSGFLPAAGNSLLLATIAAGVALAVALTLAYARRVSASRFVRSAGRVAALGYAVPGTVLAIGLLIPLAGIDNHVDALLRSTLGVSTGLFLSGSLFAITLAYVIRFLAVALAPIEAGLGRVSTNLDAAARTLGESALSVLWRVHLPLLIPPLGAAALLVFVDCMKELPATLLLRPFNFETLATHVYSLASIEQLEQASLGALTIVLVGLIPVLLLHEAIAGGRPGRSSR